MARKNHAIFSRYKFIMIFNSKMATIPKRGVKQGGRVPKPEEADRVNSIATTVLEELGSNTNAEKWRVVDYILKQPEYRKWKKNDEDFYKLALTAKTIEHFAKDKSQYMTGGAVMSDSDSDQWKLLFQHHSPWLDPNVDSFVPVSTQDVLDSSIIVNVKEHVDRDILSDKILDFATALPEYKELMELLPEYIEDNRNADTASNLASDVISKTVSFFDVMKGAGFGVNLIPYKNRGLTYKTLENVFPEISEYVDHDLRKRGVVRAAVYIPFDKRYVDDLLYHNLPDSKFYDKNEVIAYATQLDEYKELKKRYADYKSRKTNKNLLAARAAVDAVLDKTSDHFSDMVGGLVELIFEGVIHMIWAGIKDLISTGKRKVSAAKRKVIESGKKMKEIMDMIRSNLRAFMNNATHLIKSFSIKGIYEAFKEHALPQLVTAIVKMV